MSGTYNAKGHGLLTYFVLKGLQGEADGNKDGAIDLSELFDYVKPRVARREYNNEQYQLPLEVAEQISKEANRYPSFLVAATEWRCRDAVAKKVLPVGVVAQREGWFTD